MDDRVLVLITNTFPFGKGETFIDNELPFYNKFYKVYIVSIDYNNSLRIKNLDSSINVIRIPKWNNLLKILWLIYSLFLPEFYKELFQLVKKKKLFRYRLYSLLAFLATGNRIVWYTKNKFLPKGNHFVFYSYWLHHGAYASIKLRNVFGGKAVSRCHRYDLYEYRNNIQYLPLRKYLLNHLDKIYSISEDGAKYLRKYNTDSNICISRLGTKDNGINECKLNDEELCIVSCSWISPVKRIHRILEALSSIYSMRINWVHIGGGDGLIDLKEKSKTLPQNVSVHFLGSMNPSEIIDLYKKQSFHVFVNVSESEGIPVSIMEAMSFGIPVIATDVGGTSEIVVDKLNGFLLKKDFSNDELASLLFKIKQMSESEYNILCNEARNTWENKYNSSKNYSEFVDSLL